MFINNPVRISKYLILNYKNNLARKGILKDMYINNPNQNCVHAGFFLKKVHRSLFMQQTSTHGDYMLPEVDSVAVLWAL